MMFCFTIGSNAQQSSNIITINPPKVGTVNSANFVNLYQLGPANNCWGIDARFIRTVDSAKPMWEVCKIYTPVEIEGAQELFDPQHTVQTPYGPEYILTIDNKQYRAITPDHIKDIEVKEARLDADEKVIAAQQSEITNLHKALDAAKTVEAIDSKMDTILHNIISNRNDAISFHQDYITHLEKVEAGQPKKLFIDKLPFRLGFTLLAAGANTRTAFFPPSPCR